MKLSTKLRVMFNGGRKNHIRVRVNRPDRSVDVFYVHRNHIKDKLIEIPEEKKAFGINKQSIFMGEGGFREVIYNHNSHEPVDYLQTKDARQIEPETVYAGIHEKVSRNIITAQSVDYDKLKMLVTISIIAIVGVGGLLYYIFSSAMGALQIELEEQRELIEHMAEIIARLRP